MRLYHKTFGKDKDASEAFLKDRRAAESQGREEGEPWPKRAKKKPSKPKKTKRKWELTLTQMVGKGKQDTAGKQESCEEASSGQESSGEARPEDFPLDLPSESCYGILKEPLTVMHPLSGCSDPYALTRVLHEVDPRYIVLYDAELTFVRQLEIYKASQPGKPLRYVVMSRQPTPPPPSKKGDCSHSASLGLFRICSGRIVMVSLSSAPPSSSKVGFLACGN